MIEHIITKKKPDGKYIAWFRFENEPPYAEMVRLKFGIWQKPVTFDIEELKSNQSGTHLMIIITSNSSTLKNFNRVKVDWMAGEKVVFKDVVTNSGKFEDLSKESTFAASQKKLEVFEEYRSLVKLGKINPTKYPWEKYWEKREKKMQTIQ
ncbi:hypothetical protein LAG90_15670 [Marinilongibacter aquaticus]|uniref:hypothetical protein n=1 Tax=Marinilongibacter aquaticus TaxID=2975157 RepID=UPI0021BDC175|nr:hypothetical protein [Marinilongibacter aquaticus]UBM58242.1 hypothetical protein LAG90_15670 [Marinilongibacter aquaticus]